MDNQALQKIRETISRSQQVSLAVGKNPTIDQMASALGLALTLEAQGKKVSVVSPTAPIVEVSSLVGIDKVKTSSEGSSGDLVVSFPYREGEIEKVSYTIDDGFLNIVVKAGESGLTFTERDVTYKRGTDKPELLITIGITRMGDVTGLFSEEALKDVMIINIDNSNDNEGYGGMVLVSPKFSSLSEQVADLMLNLGYDIDIDVAQNLLSGLTTATDNFQSPNTSYLAFEIAAILLKRGARRDRSRAVEASRPMQQAQQPAQQPFPRPQPRPQQQVQQQRREDRQDRRDVIRDALRAQSQARGTAQPQVQEPVQPLEQDVQPMQVRQEQPRPDRPVAQPQAQNRSQDQKPPSDWLTPKVYKGSSSI